MSDGYACPWGCKGRSATFAAARDHARQCPTKKRRLDNLGFDLACKVESGKLPLEEAERIQAARPTLEL